MKKKIEEYLSNASTAFAMGQCVSAMQWCDKVLKIQSNAKAYFLKGSCCLVQEQLSRAKDFFEQAIHLQPEEGEYYFHLGLCNYKMDFSQEALQNFGTAETYGVSEASQKKMFYIAGIINQEKNENDAALINFTKVENIKGHNADQRDILIRKAQIYVKRRELEMAEKCARSLKFLSPDDFYTYQLLFQIDIQQKNYVDAENVLKEAGGYFKNDLKIAVEIGFDYAMLYCIRAEEEPEQKQVHYEKAIQYLGKMLSNPEVHIGEKYEILLTMTDIYRQLGDIDSAILMSTRIVDEPDEEFTEFLERAKYNLSEAYLLKKKYQKVQEYAVQLKESDNMLYRCHAYYIEAYSQMMMAKAAPDLKDSAIRLYQIAIAYYRNCMAAHAGDFIALTYRIKANADIGEKEKAEELCALLPVEAREEMQRYLESQE